MPLVKDYKAKLVVFIFAIFIWFFVVTENEYETNLEVPITPVNIPAGRVILNDLPAMAKVRIKGNGKDLIALTLSGGARLELDLSDVKHTRTFKLEPKHVMLSRPIATVSSKEIIMPDSVVVVLDDLVRKRVPVHANVKLTPAPGYTVVGDFKITPDSVAISGPSSLVAQINEVYTVEKEFTDVRFDLQEIFPLAPLPYNKVTCATKEVEVYLNIQKLLEMTVSNIPVEVRNVPRNLKVTVIPSTLSLVLEGGGELLTQLSRDQIVAYIDYNRVRNLPGNEFPAVIERPPGISYRDVRPRTFKLVFERATQK